jgi:hypothetical protein
MNKTWVRKIWFSILTPFHLPFPLSGIIHLCKHSTTRRNNSGDKGKPFLKPVEEWKKGETEKSINKDKETKE